MNGWIKLHREITKWEWYDKSEMVHLFLHFLLLANHKKKSWRGQVVEGGQFITGLQSLKRDTGISTQTLRTCIKRLESTGEITNRSTNKYRIITIVNWEEYQSDDKKLTSKLTSKLTNNQQSTNKQLTANKNDKNVKKDKNIKQPAELAGVNELLGIFKEFNPATNFGNKTQRKACESIIKEKGLDGATKLCKYAMSVQGNKYAPTITTPHQLWNKLSELKIYYERENKSQIQSL